MEAIYKEIVEVIKKHDKFLICSHAHPDGDGIGSTLALGLALESMGKKVVMYNEDGVPRAVDFLQNSGKVVTAVGKGEKFDVTFMVDCAQPDRAGKDFPPPSSRGILVCIDHHASGREEGDIVCLDERSASTGEVVYRVIKKMGVGISPDIATMILTTIVVDTGFFRYSNTTSAVLKLAAELLEAGASTWDVCRNMEERVPRAQIELLSNVLKTIVYHLGGRLALVVLTKQMFDEAGATVEMAEEFINYPRAVEGVMIAALIREKSPREFKISLRSKNSIDVAALCSKFGGGGHAMAAGCNMEGSLGEVKQKLIEAVSKEIGA